MTRRGGPLLLWRHRQTDVRLTSGRHFPQHSMRQDAAEDGLPIARNDDHNFELTFQSPLKSVTCGLSSVMTLWARIQCSLRWSVSKNKQQG